jgi:biopolymer transport protein ExbD
MKAVVVAIALFACKGSGARDELERERAELAAERAELEREKREMEEAYERIEAKRREEMATGLKIDLPSGTSAEIDVAKASLVIDVTANGDVIIGGKPMADDDALARVFSVAYQRDKQTQVVIRADKDVPYALVVRVMDRAKQAGLSHLAMATK